MELPMTGMASEEAVVLFSGGIGSWAAAHRFIEITGSTPTLLFTDTMMEDEDLYRFLDEAVTDLACPLITLRDGRDLWQLFREEGMLGNTRADLCSRILKRELARAWIDAHGTMTVVVGIDWTEAHRFDRMKERWLPHTIVAPLCDPPYQIKEDWLRFAEERGLAIPRLYEMGFTHNNCGGFCVKQGHAGFRHLLNLLPERYAYHEQQEREFRQSTGKDVAILRDRRGGETRPYTLAQLRQDIEANPQMLLDDWGGCGCMVD